MPVDVVEMKGKSVGPFVPSGLGSQWPWELVWCLAGAGARTACGSDLRAWVSELQTRCTFRSLVLSSFSLVTFPVAKGGCPAFLIAEPPASTGARALARTGRRA